MRSTLFVLDDAACGCAVMIMAMTATPLAMLGCGFDTSDVKPVIQWHVFGMFMPSFFTGSLIARLGAPRVMRAGFVLLIGHVAVAASGPEFAYFLSALVLPGVGRMVLGLAALLLLLLALGWTVAVARRRPATPAPAA